MKRWRGFFFIAAVIFMVWIQKDNALASVKSVEIGSCKINSSNKRQVIVSAKVKSKVPGTDGKYYLFALQPYQTKPAGSAKPLGTPVKGSYLTFRTMLNLDSSDSCLYSKFVVAVKRKGGGYEAASKPSYITNPDAVAKYRYSFPKALSKKGLQIYPAMLSDAEDLGVKHAAVNIVLDTLMVSASQKNQNDAYAYRYQGKTYWFSRSGAAGIDYQVRKMTESNMVVTGILLLQGQSEAAALIPSGVSNVGNFYYGLNTGTKEGVQTLGALMSFLGERYMGSSKGNGRISNWIVGNEVDFYRSYNYMGEYSLAKYTDLYARSFRVISTALRSVYSNARVYIPLTHCWNQLQPQGGSFTSRSMLEGFVNAIKSQGNIPWNVAYHAYPQPLIDPVFWDDIGTNQLSSTYVTLNNINVLTDYVKKLNKNARVILSEQGFTSFSQPYGYDEELQAAAFAYAYYIVEFNSQIDSFIVTRHVDHEVEEQQGIFNGLWSNTPGALELPNKKKEIWNVYKFIDTTASKSVTDFALKRIGISSWSRTIKGFSWSKFNKMSSYQTGGFSLVTKSSGQKSLSNNWNFSYNAGTQTDKKQTVVSVDNSSNNLTYKGVGQTYRKPLNFTSKPILVFDISVNGTKARDANVRVRFFSGKHIYEASGELLTNQKQQFSVNLYRWNYNKSVDKIQIWVRPSSDGSWSSKGKITISNMRQAARRSRIYIGGFKSTLAKGKRMSLKAVGGSGKVTWSSSRPSVAVISKRGVVTAKKRGTTVIRAKIGGYTLMQTLQVK